MIRLSDTQLAILSTAEHWPDGNMLSLPGSLPGGAAGKVVRALLARGFTREQIFDTTRQADARLDRSGGTSTMGRGVLLLVAPTGLEALGIEPRAADAAQASTAPGAGHTDSPVSVGS